MHTQFHTSSSTMKISFTLIIALAFGFLENVVSNDDARPYEAIFNFGDSLSDTGNFLVSGGLPASQTVGKLPYGETFFRRATGRFSDGRLMIDFIAEAYGLPYLPPYLSLTGGQDIHHGVNFAVAGATALDAEIFYQRGLGKALWTNHSLTVQLGWFRKLKSSLCTTKQDCDRYFKRSLFLVGEIGGNDYNYPAFVRATLTELASSVPSVVEAIAKAIDALIAEGAVELVVPGNLPVGCSVSYLTLFGSQNKEDYDEDGCLKAFNAFARYHNEQLHQALEKLRQKHPHARIIYADYYGAAERFFHAPKEHGFTNALRACCGGGGPLNFNMAVMCGLPGSKACTNPSTYVNWDGIHLTEAAYRQMAKSLIEGPFSEPQLKSSSVKIAWN